jgi:hypothetical protein
MGGGVRDGRRYVPPLYNRERHPVPIAQKAEWAPGLVWMGAENLDSRTVQPLAILYTDCVIPAHVRPTFSNFLKRHFI